MFDRFSDALRAMYKAMEEKMARPGTMLELRYQELRSSLTQVRKDLSAAIEDANALAVRLEEIKLAGDDTADLELEMRAQHENIDSLKTKLSVLECDFDRISKKI